LKEELDLFKAGKYFDANDERLCVRTKMKNASQTRLDTHFYRSLSIF